MSSNRAFTLLELLVVITIIGILSSIVIVSMSGSTDSATIAKGKAYAQQIHALLGHEARGVWDFDEGTIDTCPGLKDVCDYSGYGNYGTFYGDTYFVQSDINGYALSFDGASDYVRVIDSSSLSITGTRLTLEAWIKSNIGAANGAIIHKDSHYSLFWRATGAITYADSITWSYSSIDDYGNTLTGLWNHVVVTFNGSIIRFYINGVQIGSKIRSGSLIDNSNDLSIGSYNFASGFFNGLIDEVRIYAEALPTTEIQKHYTQGLNKLLVSQAITQSEYDQRMKEFNQSLVLYE